VLLLNNYFLQGSARLGGGFETSFPPLSDL
jgi:hypothetical protein